jgi:diguanylate cyclase (GGDEF)-like protein/PAS domain S-box-containing protein
VDYRSRTRREALGRRLKFIGIALAGALVWFGASTFMFALDARQSFFSHRERLALVGACALLACLGLAMYQVILVIAADRKFARALAQSERRHRALIEEQSEVIGLARSDGRLEYVNAAFNAMFPEAHAPLERNLLQLTLAADRSLMEQALIEALTAPGPVAVECRTLREGKECWLSWRLRGQATLPHELVHAVGRDVTLQKKAEAALRASEEFLLRTNRVAGVGGWELRLTTGEILWSSEVRRIHGVADDYVPTLDGSLAFYTPESRDRLRQAIAAARSDGAAWDLELELVATGAGVTHVRAVGEAECNEDGVPFRLIGTLQDITDRKRLERQLETSERFIRRITDSIPARLAYLGTNRHFHFANRALAERFHMPREQLIGCDIMDILPPVSRPAWATILTGALAGQRQRLEYDDTVAGQVRRIEVQLIPDMSERAEVQGIVAIGVDITHLKRVEQELRELTEVFDNTTDYVAQADSQGNVHFINKSARRALGFDQDQPLQGRTFREFFTPETSELFRREIAPTVKRDLVWVGETQVVLKGKVVPVNHMVIGHFDAEGQVSRYSSLMRDITVEVAARKELARQTTTLNTVIEAIPAMMCVYDRGMHIILVNQAYERWRGRSRKDLIGRTLEETMDAGDFEESRPWAERALAGETVSYEQECPQARDIRHVSVTYVPLKMPDGEIGGFFGVAHDITRHREENIRLALLSERDSLTGLLNRAGLEQFIESKVTLGEGAGLSVLYIDLDHFKPVNDTYGHAAGDRVLQAFALRLLQFVRPTDAVARLGGDEFAVILLGIRDIADAGRVAEKIVSAARSPFPISQSQYASISASVGVACNADSTGGWHALIERADSMAYAAKAAGRDRFVLARESSEAGVERAAKRA